MGAAFFIVLEKTDVDFDTFVNGKFLSKDSEQLEKIASNLDLPTLEDYVSYSPDEAQATIAEFGGTEEVTLPDQKWFAPQEGLDYTSKLAEHIRANPSVVNDANAILSELQEFKNLFEKAKAIGTRWHLRVDF